MLPHSHERPARVVHVMKSNKYMQHISFYFHIITFNKSHLKFYSKMCSINEILSRIFSNREKNIKIDLDTIIDI